MANARKKKIAQRGKVINLKDPQQPPQQVEAPKELTPEEKTKKAISSCFDLIIKANHPGHRALEVHECLLFLDRLHSQFTMAPQPTPPVSMPEAPEVPVAKA